MKPRKSKLESFSPRYKTIWETAIENLAQDEDINWDKIENSSSQTIVQMYLKMVENVRNLESLYAEMSNADKYKMQYPETEIYTRELEQSMMLGYYLIFSLNKVLEIRAVLEEL